MKSALSFVIGIVVGAGLLGVVAWNSASSLMLVEMESPYGVDETVAKIKESAEKVNQERGTKWVSPGVKPLHKTIKKHGGADLLPVMLIDLCEPNHAVNILSHDQDRILSVMMPCTISVYKKSDGKTYIAHMNAGLMGGMFGGNVAKVMNEVDEQQQEFLAFAKH
jgi:uncharacterized protein (DUF302 family)